MFVRGTLVTALGALGATPTSPIAFSQNWPTQPLRIIVPNVPGGDQAAQSIDAARKNGVTYDETTYAALVRCGAEAGIPFPQ